MEEKYKWNYCQLFSLCFPSTRLGRVGDSSPPQYIQDDTNSAPKQRLGTVHLRYTEDEEIDAYQWAALAARHENEARNHVSSLERQLAEQTETARRLNEQLQSLIEAKQSHEVVLLQKFSELLNSKKLKIRDQQRILATAKVDPATGQSSLIFLPFRSLAVSPDSHLSIYLSTAPHTHPSPSH
jgi:hypothetical protein